MEIMRMICALSDMSTLASFSRVSKALHTIAAEYIWTSFDWDGSERVLRFLEKIVHKPELSHLVTHVNIHLKGEPEVDKVVNKNERTIRNKVTRLKVPESEIPCLISSTPALSRSPLWSKEIKEGWPGAFVALVVALLPNLESIRVHTRAIEEIDCLCYFIYWASRPHRMREIVAPPGGTPNWAIGKYPLPALPRLREVHIGSTDPALKKPRWEQVSHVQQLLSLFHLPSLEHLTAPMDIHDPVDGWGYSDPPKAENIKSLSLTMIREKYLGKLLTATPFLEKLEWDWCARPYEKPGSFIRLADERINLQRLSENLGKLSGTLKHLKITGSIERLKTAEGRYEGRLFIKLVDNGTLGILKPLNKLQSLHVPLVFLLGIYRPHENDPLALARSLPTGVEHLTLTDETIHPLDARWNRRGFFKLVQRYISNWKDFTPRLRSLKLEVTSEGAAEIPKALIKLTTGAPFDFKVEFKSRVYNSA
ncbi:unnamed protein product [Penicillium salamii]|uniref:F-box domain-containing protein n=1 Tax=Penicillium salamii TaxID=1612424 RepID=A0A9W4JHP5_9EURO|nr:unnamed protein product [Penicillium salamii]CAG8391434.1 unnamed protein product [Penicillium salamii]CAG8394590.1 unnamed protein product [Penicillium salamii]CAG8397959.1 unnamed protein product [Penicillium salamii]